MKINLPVVAASRLRAIAVGLLALSQFSCAAGGLTPIPQSMPVARASLLPEYRFFYDALGDYGDWVLIEPYGYVFRPKVTFDAWRPFGNGFWAPTDLYGWVWVSAEPFGWATYHYGQWLYDPYQHWVWIPGLEWAPARVNWQAADDYVGWSPLMLRGASYTQIPGGVYSYVRAGDLADTDLQTKIVTEQDLGDQLAHARPIENLTQNHGVTFNRGPSMEWVERTTGPLRRARIDDLVTPRPGRSPDVAGGAAQRTPASSARSDTSTSVQPTQRAAERAARQARIIVDRRGAVPERVSVVRPFGVPGTAEPAADQARKTRQAPTRKTVAKPDSAR
jgi:hypothetical protein